MRRVVSQTNQGSDGEDRAELGVGRRPRCLQGMPSRSESLFLSLYPALPCVSAILREIYFYGSTSTKRNVLSSLYSSIYSNLMYLFLNFHFLPIIGSAFLSICVCV